MQSTRSVREFAQRTRTSLITAEHRFGVSQRSATLAKCSCRVAHKGLPGVQGNLGLLADATTAQASGEILFETISNKEMELPKDGEEGRAERSYLHISMPTTRESSQIKCLNSKEGRPMVQQPGGLPRSLFLFRWQGDKVSCSWLLWWKFTKGKMDGFRMLLTCKKHSSNSVWIVRNFAHQDQFVIAQRLWKQIIIGMLAGASS